MFKNGIIVRKSCALTAIKLVISPTDAALRDVVDKRNAFL
jgi:hypothetical protein